MKLLAYVNPPETVEVPVVDVLISRAEIDQLIEELQQLRFAPNHDGGAHFHFEPGKPDNKNELTFALSPGESREG